MMHFGGLAVGFAIVFMVLIPLSTNLARTYPGRTTWRDWILGIVVTLVWMVLVTSASDAVWPDLPPFVDAVISGVGVAPVAFVPEIIAAMRRRRRPAPVSVTRSPTSLRAARVPVARFSETVHAHFANPTIRARYVIAAYRRGMIPAEYVPGLAASLAPLLSDGAWADLAAVSGDGLDAAVARAAHSIGYAPTPDEELAEAVERLIYTALCSTDPGLRLATVEFLAPPAQPVRTLLAKDDPRLYCLAEQASGLRAEIADVFNTRYAPPLPEGVGQRFEDPMVRARHLIAAYRHDLIRSGAVPSATAAFFVDLPGAGEAWTELAMASNDACRAGIDPIMERAAAEIDYDAEERDEAIAIVEMAAYRAIVDDDVLGQGNSLWDKGYETMVPEVFREFLAVYGIYGFDVPEQTARIRADLAVYLNDRYE